MPRHRMISSAFDPEWFQAVLGCEVWEKSLCLVHRGHQVFNQVFNPSLLAISNKHLGYGQVVQTEPRLGDQGSPPGSKKGVPLSSAPAKVDHRFSARHCERASSCGGQSESGFGEYCTKLQSMRS